MWWFFQAIFDHFWRNYYILAKIGSKLKPIHHNQVMLVQIPDTNCSIKEGTNSFSSRCQFNQTLCNKQKLPEHSVWQKNCHSFSPAFCLELCPLRWGEIRQINAPFTKSVFHLPNTICQKKAFQLVCWKKSGKNVGEIDKWCKMRSTYLLKVLI